MIVRRIRVDDETSQRLIQSHPFLYGFPNANDYGLHEVGSLYAVMRIMSFKDPLTGDRQNLCMSLDEGEESWTPALYPVELYEVVDARLPKGWSVSFSDAEDSRCMLLISFEEAITDLSFFEKLFDADELPHEEGQQLISIYKKRVQEVKELSKDFYAAESNGTV